MENAADFQDWELLQGPDDVIPVALAISVPASATAVASPRDGGDSGGVVKLHYFGPDTEKQNPGQSFPSDGDGEGGNLSDAGGPSFVESGSGDRLLGKPPRKGSGLADVAVFCAVEESPSSQETPPHDDLEGGHGSIVSSQSEAVLEGVHTNGGDGEGEGAFLGGAGDDDVVEAGNEEFGELGDGDSSKMPAALEPPVERSNEENDLEVHRVAKGGKAGMVWWKLPMELLKFCAFRIKPVWSICIAAALVGVVMLRRRLLKRRPKSRSIPLRVSVDEKFMVRAIRLKEAFSVIKRVPVIRSTLPTAGVTPWPAVAFT